MIEFWDWVSMDETRKPQPATRNRRCTRGYQIRTFDMKTCSKLFLSLFYFCLFVFFCHSAQAGDHRSMADDKEMPNLVLGYDVRVLLDANMKDIKAVTELWMEQLAEKNGLAANVVIYSDFTAMLEDFKDGRVDLASTVTLDYLRIAEDLGTELAYSSIYANGKPTKKYLLIVRSDAGFVDVKDLAQKKLAVAKIDDAALLFLNTYLLRNKLLEAPGFFSFIVNKRKSSQAILSVFFRQTDVCIATREAFDIMVALNPQVGRQLKVMASSPEMVCTVSFFRKDYSPKAKAVIRNGAVKLRDTAAGRQLLTLFKLTDIFLLKDSDLDSFRSLLNEYRQLKGDVQVHKHKRDNN